MAKKVFIGVAVVAVVAIGWFIKSGMAPTTPGAEGTIESAKRYHSGQITTADVVLKDPEIAALVQTEFFHRLVTDKGFQKMVADGSMQKVDMNDLVLLSKALETPEMRSALQKGDMTTAMAAVERVELAKSSLDRTELAAALRTAFDKAEFREALAKNDLQAAAGVVERVELAHSSFDRADINAYLSAALDKAEFRTALSRNDAAAAMQSLERIDVASLQQLERAELRSFLGTDAAKSILSKGDVEALAALERVEFRQAVGYAGFERLIDSASFQQAMAGGDARSFVAER